MNWQDISTAPKNKSILIYSEDGDVLEAIWYTAWYNDRTNQGWMPANLNEEYGYYVKATHWMPLPEPPKE